MGKSKALVPKAADPIAEVWQYWVWATKSHRSVLTPDRRRVLAKRLSEEPGSAEEKIHGLKMAVDGAVRDPFFNGSETGRSYLGFENIFVHQGRNRIEKLQRLALAPERTRGNSRADRIDAKVADSIKIAMEGTRRLKP